MPPDDIVYDRPLMIGGNRVEPTRIRAHPRRGTRGVRRHIRTADSDMKALKAAQRARDSAMDAFLDPTIPKKRQATARKLELDLDDAIGDFVGFRYRGRPRPRIRHRGA